MTKQMKKKIYFICLVGIVWAAIQIGPTALSTDVSMLLERVHSSESNNYSQDHCNRGWCGFLK